MHIEKLSIKAATTSIIVMVGVVAIFLSLFAGSYFRQAALNEQVSSLARVIEVASHEVLRSVSEYTFDLGMILGHNKQLITALDEADSNSSKQDIVALLDDPFINGFVGFANINLVKLRVYSLDLELIAESSVGISGIENHLPKYLATQITRRSKIERLKAMDALWLSDHSPFFSTLVPLGGLHSVGYLEVVVDPVFNLHQIGKITKTPISVFTSTDKQTAINDKRLQDDYLPVTFTLLTSDGEPAFKIVGYEDVGKLSVAMKRTQLVTTSGFLLLTFGTLLFALWLFNKFLFIPLGQMVEGMKQIAHGKLDLIVNKKGLREFSIVADSFESMINQVKLRTNELERLLNLDGSAILRFGQDGEVIYINKGAIDLFGFQGEKISDLELCDLFSDEAIEVMANYSANSVAVQDGPLQIQLGCVHKKGTKFTSDAIITPLVADGGFGYTMVLSAVADNEDTKLARYVANKVENNEHRIWAVERSLNSILEMAGNNHGVISSLGAIDGFHARSVKLQDDKRVLREQVVRVMQSALVCWESDLGKTKLELAEESGIWQVYIDKSTPTTRTLDKYLHIDSCPKNPRNQRVSDTAEFVLKKTKSKLSSCRKKLEEELEAFRTTKSGV